MLPHGVTKVFHSRSSLNERSAEHGLAGMTAKMEATYKNSGVISLRLFSSNTSMTSAAVCTCFLESVEHALVCLEKLLVKIIGISN